MSNRKRYVFDIECDGLLDEATKIWIAVVIDLDTKKEYIFSDYTGHDGDGHVNSMAAFFPFIEEADELIGHNIISYDIPVLKKLADWEPDGKVRLVDTMLLSQMMDYKRFGFGHSLERWGEYLGLHKKEIEDWSEWTDDKVERCLVDTRINLKVYHLLEAEVKRKIQKKPCIKKSVSAEFATAEFFAKAKERGWLIDVRKLKRTMKRMEDQLQAIRDIVEPQMLGRYKPKYGYVTHEDGFGEEYKLGKTRKPVFKKNGEYNSHTANLFGIEPQRGLSDRPIAGEYTPLEYHPPDINSNDSLKQFLFAKGWKPLDWNVKKIGRQWVKTSPKLCEVSLAKLGRIGKYIDRYNTTSSRYNILRGWYENLDENNRLHGDAFSIGTPTFRCRHKGIVNVPSTEAVWGKAMRAIFIADPGNVIVGGDSAGNQARALCHDVNSEDFTRRRIGPGAEIHQDNADILSSPEMKVERAQAKRWYYAWLFGAGAEKLSRYILGYNDKELGQELSDRFLAANPELDDLLKKLAAIYEKTLKINHGEKGYIPAIDGRKVYIDSKHKALNYRLQSTEAITCKAALLYAVRKLKEENIPWWPLIFYHDELQIETPKEYGQRVAEILEEAFREAPKWFGVNIMDGDSKVGRSWLQTH